jgi:hypothetical protein
MRNARPRLCAQNQNFWYPPLQVQAPGAPANIRPRELGGFTSRYVIHSALGLRAAPAGQVWLAGLRSAPPGLHNSAGQPTPRQNQLVQIFWTR